MPPRFTYWTIILDGQPTAFRAADREQLLPTLKQLQAKNPDAALKWFAHGRMWESPDQLRELRARKRAETREARLDQRRGRGWRPGGKHEDPRAKFKRETFQARKRREKKALGRAGGPRQPGRPGESGGPVREAPAKALAKARDLPRLESAVDPAKAAPSHKTAVPRLRKPR
jgi:hypothetical protein